MTTTGKIADTLRGHEFLKGFEPHEVERLAAMAREVTFERNQIIFREGDPSRQFFLIVHGRVALEVSALGRTLRVQTVEAGEELGWSALLPTVGKQFQARALEAVRAFVFDGDALREACDADAAFGYDIMKRLLRVVASRLQATRLQLLDLYAPPGGRSQ